jgi:hypothetical protein
MAHRIEIQLGAFSADEHHKVRNFVEDLWLQMSRRGWAEPQNFDQSVKPGARFEFSFPARASHEATTLTEALVDVHFMRGLATVTHQKRASANG